MKASALPHFIYKVLPDLSADVFTIGSHHLIEGLKIPDLRFHELRHNVASTLTMVGISQRAVMEILGHKDLQMTLRYQYLSPGHLQKAMSSLEMDRIVANSAVEG